MMDDMTNRIVEAGKFEIAAMEDRFEPGKWDGGGVGFAVNEWNRKNAPDFTGQNVSGWKSPLYRQFLELDARSVLPDEQLMSLRFPEDPAGIRDLWNVYSIAKDVKGKAVRTLIGTCTGNDMKVVSGDLDFKRLIDDVVYVVFELVREKVGGVAGGLIGGNDVVGMRWKQINHRNFLDNKGANEYFR